MESLLGQRFFKFFRPHLIKLIQYVDNKILYGKLLQRRRRWWPPLFSISADKWQVQKVRISATNLVLKQDKDKEKVVEILLPKVQKKQIGLLSLSSYTSMIFPSYFKFQNEAAKVVEEKMKKKSRKEIEKVTLDLIHSLDSVNTTDPDHIKRLENLCTHLHKYPSSKGVAIRQNVVGSLLKIMYLSKRKDEKILQVREALSLLGHNEPLDSRGIRILSIDGGGMRGIMALEVLKAFEEETGKKIHELFDFICGVSTGAIIASFLGFHKISISDIEHTYNVIGTRIFRQSLIEGARGWVLSHSYYNTRLYEDILRQFVGDDPMIDLGRSLTTTPHVAIVSTLVSDERVAPFVFRSYELPHRFKSSYKGSSRHPVWAAVRASSAAPGYFDEFCINNTIHHDGGILANNATHIAIHEARKLWPNHRLQCVISLGLGRNEFPVSSAHHTTKHQANLQTLAGSGGQPKALSLAQKFSRIVDSATDTELVHETLNDNLESKVYFRFNPYLPEYLKLDETRPEKMALMSEAASMYLRRNRNKLLQACGRLTLKKLPSHVAVEHMRSSKEILKYVLSSSSSSFQSNNGYYR